MGWWQIVTSAAKRIPWGSVLTFGAEKWLERRRRQAEHEQATETARRPVEAPASAPDVTNEGN